MLEKTSQVSSDGDRCSKPASSWELRAGEVDTTHALVRESRGPRTLACPTDSFNARWRCVGLPGPPLNRSPLAATAPRQGPAAYLLLRFRFRELL